MTHDHTSGDTGAAAAAATSDGSAGPLDALSDETLREQLGRTDLNEWEIGRVRDELRHRDESRRTRSDNTLALSQVIGLLERQRMGWFLSHDPDKHTPEFLYELRIFDGPARGVYRGSTATMAATGAQDMLAHYKVGWDS
jgi:hypothetical protein